MTSPARRATGFTILEVMVTVAIVGILAAIVYPNYADNVRRGKIIDGTARLSDLRVRMEQYFMDNRKYVKGGGACGIDVADAKAFTVKCEGTDTTYTITATGKASEGMGDFAYTINEQRQMRTTGLPADWKNDNKDSCWILKKDGTC